MWSAKERPPMTWVTPVSRPVPPTPTTGRASGRDVVVPSPSWPAPFDPQHETPPPITAQ